VRLIFAAMAATCFSAAAYADTFRIIDDDQEAAQIRVDLIRQAQAELVLELFRASDDQMVLFYLALLRDAARRGVKCVFSLTGRSTGCRSPYRPI
jgi:phosphatidylserine/phosphatidylglycerophosphate/cardiolipin synthase-like enzyme